MDIRTEILDLDGLHMRAKYIDIKEKTDTEPTLVFLHEGLGCLEMWRDFPEEICEKMGLNGFVYERVGFGQSSPLGIVPRPMDYLDREGRDILPRVLELAGIARPLLIGHSDGGTIALMYGACHPDKPVAIVTEAAHVFVEDVTIAGIVEAGKHYFEGALKPRLEKYHGDNTEKAFRGWHDTWLTPEFAHWNMEHLLPKITAPVLAIQGIDDEYGTQMQVQSIVENSSGPAKPMMVPDCAHVPHFQAREPVVNGIIQFLKKIL